MICVHAQNTDTLESTHYGRLRDGIEASICDADQMLSLSCFSFKVSEPQQPLQGEDTPELKPPPCKSIEEIIGQFVSLGCGLCSHLPLFPPLNFRTSHCTH